MPERHALLGASSASKWLNCQASARLEELITKVMGDNQTEYTKEGTIAHSLAEKSLNQGGVFSEDFRTNDGYNQEMHSAVVEYFKYVSDLFKDALSHDRGAVKKHEVELNYSKYVKDGFGTGDTIIIADGVMHVIDFKYGQGVMVDAVDNPQMRLYALGALEEFGFLYNISNVRMHIVQPRMENISVDEITVVDLEEWGNSIKEIGLKAFVGDAPCNPGEHCQFCRARAICRARADLLKKFAVDVSTQKDFKLLAPEELEQVFRNANLVESYIKQIKSYILDQLMQGKQIPGLKLKAPRLTRQYADQTTVEEKLRKMGYDDAVIHKPRELIGITELTKLIKKAGMDELENNGFIIKAGGNPSVVTSDTRCEEYIPTESILNDFEVIE